MTKTAEDVKQKRFKLMCDIYKLVTEFNEDTGFYVTDIDYRLLTVKQDTNVGFARVPEIIVSVGM